MKLCLELEGMKLEGTYSGKNMAAFIDFMKMPEHRDRPVPKAEVPEVVIDWCLTRLPERSTAEASGPAD